MAVWVVQYGGVTVCDVQLMGSKAVADDVELGGPGEDFQVCFLIILVAQDVSAFKLDIQLLDAVSDSDLQVELGG
jgi:hypothetical protein